jgi:glycosyltransferase involved in cell wall biosynthesis
VDHFIANSDTVAGRIKKYYRRDSTVIYPPVDIDHFQVADQLGDYFLSGGRLVAYKRFDIVIDAFTKLGKPLKIFGTGPEEKSLKKRAGSNIEFLGRISDEERMRVFAQAQAFIHPQEEDFGITPIESMAAGRPVIAYRKGGATETVTDGLSGLLFSEQSWEELADTVLRFKSEAFNPQLIRKQAEGFAASLFRQRLHTLVNQLWREHETKVLGNR